MVTAIKGNATSTFGGAITANNINLTGNVLQVVHYLWQSQTSTTNTSYTDSGLTATITPSSTSSKILVIGSANGVHTQAATTGVRVGLFNGATELTTPQFYAAYDTSSTDNQINVPFSHLHSPNSTSAQTYIIKFYRNAGSGTVIIGANNSNSFMTLMEIAG
jgi:hypothetical protein